MNELCQHKNSGMPIRSRVLAYFAFLKAYKLIAGLKLSQDVQ
jgi:hypothetical protein